MTLRQMHGGNIQEAMEIFGVKRLVDFSANVNPLGLSSIALRAVEKACSSIKQYPDCECRKLKDAIASFHKTSSKNVVVGNGSTELIHIISSLGELKTFLIPSPTFIGYESAVLSAGNKAIFMKLKEQRDFSLDAGKLIKRMDKADAIFLCNPNNPTGKLIAKQDLIEIVSRAAEKSVFVVVDEVFIDFVDGDYSVLHETTKFDNLFVIRAFTKFFAMPGLRLGYGIGSKAVVSRLTKRMPPWSVNSLAQIAGINSLLDSEYIKRTKRFISKEKQFLFEKLCKIPWLKPHYPNANYIFIELVNTHLNSTSLQMILANKGVLIRDCSTFRFLNNRFIRVCVKTRRENNLLLRALAEVKP